MEQIEIINGVLHINGEKIYGYWLKKVYPYSPPLGTRLNILRNSFPNPLCCSFTNLPDDVEEDQENGIHRYEMAIATLHSYGEYWMPIYCEENL